MMSAGQLPLPSTYVDERSRVRGVALATWILALVTLSLRFVARRMSSAGFWYDDGLLIPAVV